jgi:hypothetical protein
VPLTLQFGCICCSTGRASQPLCVECRVHEDPTAVTKKRNNVITDSMEPKQVQGQMTWADKEGRAGGREGGAGVVW